MYKKNNLSPSPLQKIKIEIMYNILPEIKIIKADIFYIVVKLFYLSLYGNFLHNIGFLDVS